MEQNREFYLEKLTTKDGIKAVGWDNEQKAVDRYHHIAGLIPKGCKHLLDYGCGIGLFCSYFPNFITQYTGIDLMPEAISLAVIDYTDTPITKIDFVAGDVTSKPIKCDFVVCIGTFTLNKGSLEPKEYYKYMIKRLRILLQNSEIGVLVNGFHELCDYKDPNLYYHKFVDLIAMSKELGCSNITMDTAVSPYEFNLIFWK